MTAITAETLPPPLVWITKTTRAGDTNARIGIAEHLSDTWSELEMPSEFCIPVVNENSVKLHYPPIR